MPRSYWRYILAALGVATLVGLGAVSREFYDASQQREAHYNYQPAAKPRLVNVVPGQPQPKPYQPNCQNPQSQEDADLCAQWAAVEQVGEANRLSSLNLKFAIASLWATFIATLLLLWTLIENRESTRRELRAYVSVDIDSLRVNPTTREMVANIKIRNGGQTPAYRLCHAGNIVALTAEAAEKEFTRTDPRPGLGRASPMTLHTGKDLNGSIPAHETLPHEKLIAVAKGDLSLWLFGSVFYFDTFGRKRETKFCFETEGFVYPPPKRIPGQQIVPLRWTLAPFHNEST